MVGGAAQLVLAALGGQLQAARFALLDGVAANLAHGFHHARWERGAGYCTFTGLALAAAAHPQLRIAVLDCDEHCGDGTAEFTRRLPNLHNASIQGHGCPFSTPASERSLPLPVAPLEGVFRRYRRALDRAFARLDAIAPDLVIYQAGVDCHRDDPLHSIGLSALQLARRDRAVFQWARDRGTPIFFVLAGGYLERDQLVALHLQTFDTCLEVFSQPPNVPGSPSSG